MGNEGDIEACSDCETFSLKGRKAGEGSLLFVQPYIELSSLERIELS